MANNALTLLNLKHNKIGGTQNQLDSGHLDLGSNMVKDSGAQALSEALTTNSALTTLDLRSNSIGDIGGQVK